MIKLLKILVEQTHSFLINQKLELSKKINCSKNKRKNKKLENQRKKLEKRIILFNNSPISDSKDDSFDFDIKAKAIKEVINNHANIIALIGDYGAGKSSLTKLLYKKFWYAFRKPIFINLWDCVVHETNSNNAENSDDFNYFTKSFLYQFSLRNKKKTTFSRYINHHLSNNYGKLTFSVSNGWSVIGLFICFVFVILYFCLKTNIFVDYIKGFFKEDLLNSFSYKFFQLFCNAPYLCFLLAGIIGYFALKNKNILFSLWDSQGKIRIDDTDNFEIFKEIVNHLRPRFPFFKHKQLVIIEDLDRSQNSKVVSNLLKEIYRYVNALSDKEKDQFVFIISLKSEASLGNENHEGLKLYSKIFDYTVWIRPLHYENINEIINELLLSKITSKEIVDEILPQLYWLKQGENITVREIKDRLNETFLLYNSLAKRNNDNSSVHYNKCAAVVYLQRTFSDEFQHIIENEKTFSDITRNYVFDNKIPKIDDFNFPKELIPIEEKREVVKNRRQIFLKQFIEMLNKKDIDCDYGMYFFNYPINADIMTVEEKYIFDAIIHNQIDFSREEYNIKLIEKILENKREKIIYNAFDELKKYNHSFNEVIFEYEKLFSLALEKKTEREYLLTSLSTFAEEKISKEWNPFIFSRIVNYASVKKDELLRNSILSIFKEKTLSFYAINNNKDFLEGYRIEIIKYFPEDIQFFKDVFINSTYPIAEISTLKLLKNPNDLFVCLNFKLINKNNINEYLNLLATMNFEASLEQSLCLSLLEITDISLIPNIHKLLLNLLKKNVFYNKDLFLIISARFTNDGDIKELISYIQLINYEKLSITELKILDDLITNKITDIKLIELLEKNDLYKSAIYSRLKLNNFETFNFDNEWLSENILGLATIINQKESELFQKLRMILISNGKVGQVPDLFDAPFDFVSKEELDILNSKDIYYAIDFSRIDDDKIKMIANYCNNNKYTSENFYKFFEAVLFRDDKGNRIAEKNNIEKLFSLIDFNICKFDTLSNNQQQELLNNISSILGLDDFENAINFIKTVKCHISSITSKLHETLDTDDSLFDEYVEACNEIPKSTEEVIAYLSKHEIHSALSKEITDKLLKIKNYENYITGKSLNDNAYFFDKDIPLKDYYKVYCKNDSYFDLVKNTNLINKFYDNNVYETNIFDDENVYELDKKRIQPFMKFSQTIKLFELILSKLDTNEERKDFIRNITDFHSYKESELAIDIVLKEPYLQMFIDDEDFANVFKEKLWDNDDNGQPKKGVLKGKFTREYKKVINN